MRNSYSLLYQIAGNTAGTSSAYGDGVYSLAYKIAQNTAGMGPKFGDSLYTLFYKIAGNTAGVSPRPGDRLYDLLYKIAGNTGGNPVFGDGMHDLLYKISVGTAGGALDPDVLNFFTRAAITDAAQQSAVNNLVLALKSAGVWPKMRALYPFVGGTAASHSENLKAASFSITWAGGITHNANGVTGGASGIGYTNLNVNTTVLGSVAFGVYQRNAGACDFQSILATAGGTEYSIYTRYTNDTFYICQGTAGVTINGPMTDARGFFILSRQSVSLSKAYKNGSQIGSNAVQAPDPLPDTGFSILPNSNPNNLALAFISDGLLDSEVTALNVAVTTYQTALARNV